MTHGQSQSGVGSREGGGDGWGEGKWRQLYLNKNKKKERKEKGRFSRTIIMQKTLMQMESLGPYSLCRDICNKAYILQYKKFKYISSFVYMTEIPVTLSTFTLKQPT